MNWTGGRLRRHASNTKAAALSKVQKQNFAKPKPKSAEILREAPFHAFAQFRPFQIDSGSNPQSQDVGVGDASQASAQKVYRLTPHSSRLRLILTLFRSLEEHSQMSGNPSPMPRVHPTSRRAWTVSSAISLLRPIGRLSMRPVLCKSHSRQPRNWMSLVNGDV